MRWTKLTNIVEFPTGIAELDMTPYASESMEKSDPKPIYSLYGISNHMGEFLFLCNKLLSPNNAASKKKLC